MNQRKLNIMRVKAQFKIAKAIATKKAKEQKEYGKLYGTAQR